MLCSEASMVKQGLDGLQAVTLRCRSWGCPLCEASRRSQLVALAKSGDPTTFITLTVNPAEGSGPPERARRLVDAWRSVIKLVKHEYGYEAIPYFCVFEATKNGEPHLHVLARVGWIDQKWLSRQMKALTNSPIVDIRRVRNKKKLAYYIAKYCGKEPHRFATCKRYWTTQNWELVKFKPEPPPGRWHARWRLVRTPLGDLADEWRSQGYQVEQTRHRVLAVAQGPPDDEVAWWDYLTRQRRRGRPW